MCCQRKRLQLVRRIYSASFRAIYARVNEFPPLQDCIPLMMIPLCRPHCATRLPPLSLQCLIPAQLERHAPRAGSRQARQYSGELLDDDVSSVGTDMRFPLAHVDPPPTVALRALSRRGSIASGETSQLGKHRRSLHPSTPRRRAGAVEPALALHYNVNDVPHVIAEERSLPVRVCGHALARQILDPVPRTQSSIRGREHVDGRTTTTLSPTPTTISSKPNQLVFISSQCLTLDASL